MRVLAKGKGSERERERGGERGRICVWNILWSVLVVIVESVFALFLWAVCVSMYMIFVMLNRTIIG